MNSQECNCEYYPDPRGVSLSKCRFHFRMYSATSILAAATHSIPAVWSRFGHTRALRCGGSAHHQSPDHQLSHVNVTPRGWATGPVSPAASLCLLQGSSCAMKTQAQQRKAVCNYSDPKSPLWPGTPQRASHKILSLHKNPTMNSCCSSPLFWLHHPLWDKALPCPPPRCLP